MFGWLVRFLLNRLWTCVTTNGRHTVLIQPATVKMVPGDMNGSYRLPRALGLESWNLELTSKDRVMLSRPHQKEIQSRVNCDQGIVP